MRTRRELSGHRSCRPSRSPAARGRADRACVVPWPIFSPLALSVALAALFASSTAADPSQPPLPAGEKPPAPQLFRSAERTITDLSTPVAAAYDDDGNLFVVESWAHRVRVIGPDGSSRLTFGQRGDGPSRFLDPWGIAVTEDRVLVVDRGHGRVQVFSPGGAFLTAWGHPGSGPDALLDPHGIAVAGDRVFVADTGNHRVQVFDLAGKHLRSLGRRGDGEGELLAPEGVAVDDGGRVHVADTGHHRLVTFGADGAALRTRGGRGWGPGLFSAPRGITHWRGALYVADSENGRVQVFTAGGEPGGGWGRHALRPHEGNGRLHYPVAVAIDPRGRRAAVCEGFEDRVQVFRDDPNAPPEPPGVPGGIGVLSHYGRRCATRGSLLVIPETERATVAIYDLRHRSPILIHRIGDYGMRAGDLLGPSGVELAAGRRVFICDPLARALKIYEHEYDREKPVAYQPEMSHFVESIDMAALQRATPALRGLPPLAPRGVRADGAGNIHLIDPRAGAIIVLSPELKFRRAYGQRGGAPELLWPTDVAFGADDRLTFVVDARAARVCVYSSAGEPLYRFGDREQGPARLVRPFGIDVRGDSVLVTDAGSDRVVRYDLQGRFQQAWGDSERERPPARRMGAAQLCKPAGVRFDHDGRIIVIDHGNHRGQVFEPDGVFRTAFGDRVFVSPTRRKGAPGKRPTGVERGAGRRADGAPEGGGGAPGAERTGRDGR